MSPTRESLEERIVQLGRESVLALTGWPHDFGPEPPITTPTEAIEAIRAELAEAREVHQKSQHEIAALEADLARLRQANRDLQQQLDEAKERENARK